MELSQYKTFSTDSVIYGILNTITNKWYIGSCINFKLRMRRHYYYLTHNIHHSAKLQHSWNKYGEKVFSVQILYVNKNLSTKELIKLEEEYIHNYNSLENGYNMTDKCDEYKSFNLTKEQSQKANLSRMKAVVAIDRFTNNFINEYESVSAAAKAFNDQSTNISACCKHRLNYIKNTVFIYKSEYDINKDYRTTGLGREKSKSKEHIRKLQQSSKKCIPVYKYDSENNLIETYFSKREAERKNGFKKDKLRLEKGDKKIDGFLYSYKRYEKDIV